MEPCLFFVNYTVGGTKFGINSFLSLLVPAAFSSVENPLVIWLKRMAEHKRIRSHLKTAHSPLSPSKHSSVLPTPLALCLGL